MIRIVKRKNYQHPTTFRNFIFWLGDWAKGSRVRKHYEDVRRINRDHASDFSVRRQGEYLSNILRHAEKTVPFYRYLGPADSPLHRFPVVNKNLIRLRSDDFRSKKYLEKPNFSAITSGSTGTPFTVLHNLDKRHRHTADVRFYWDTVRHPWGTKLYYLKLWNAHNGKSTLSKKVQNLVPVDVLQMDDEKIGKLLNDIRMDASHKSILSYASALDSIVKYLKRHPLDMSDAGVLSIVATSESLDQTTKESLQAYFRCPVVSRYANLENGILGQQTSISEGEFLLNRASYHIEILDLEEDIPAKKGEIGRIVVTDLFNRAMPMIRYDTGDLGTLGKFKINGRAQFVLKKVEGRKLNTLFDTRGMPLSSLLLSNSMWKYDELDQFQLIQYDRSIYEFRLNTRKDFIREDELIREFKGYLGDDASIGISYTDEIPLLSSGKRKKMINKIETLVNNPKTKSYVY